jgi:predicted RND superfamily exporter protein
LNRILGVDVSALFARVTAFSVRHAARVVAGVAVLALAGLVLALGLSPSAAPGQLSDGDNDASSATAELHRAFGNEPVVILVKGRLIRMLLTADVQQLLGLEGCISGNLPASAKAPAPVCREFAQRKPVQVVYGPGTFINDAAGRILDQVGLSQARVQREADQAARRAIRTARAQGLGRRAQQGAADQARTLATTTLMQRVQLQTGLQSVPALNNPRFVLQLVFEPRLGAEEPKPRFSYVFPDKDAALIGARLRSDLTPSERSHAIGMLREAVASRAFALKYGSYVVTGDPVVREGVASGLSHQAAIVLVAAALFVALALALAFRARLPLLPLLLALAVAAVTFGLARVVGASLTLASVALLPVLLGLAAAFCALLQGRETTPEAVRLATAGLVVGVGLLALLVSPAPMMRGFGTMAIVGIALAFAAVLTVGVASAPFLFGRLPRGRLTLGRPRRLERWGIAAFRASQRRPHRTLWIAVGVSLLGWALGTQVEVVSDLTRLVPSDRQEVRDARALRDASGAEGQVSVLVHGKDLADPRAIAWMASYQGRMLTRHGYSERQACRKAELCPALAITNVFGGGLPRTERQARTTLASLPTYFRRNVITPDRRTASIGFVLSEMSPDRRNRVIDDMRAQLDPPAGLTARLAGQPVLDTVARSDLESSRWTLGLAAVLLLLGLLFVVYRRIEHAIVPLVPAVLATGWVALAAWVLQVPVNPISATLGAILVAIGGALGTLLFSRYGEARAVGRGAAEAIDEAWRGAGIDVTVASAVIAAGFLALTVSDFKVLRDFGVVALAGLLLEFLALMLVLPATLLVAEEGVVLRVPRGLPRRVGARSRSVFAGAGRALRAAGGRARRISPPSRK